MSDEPTLQLLGGRLDEASGLRRYEPGATLPAVVRLDADRRHTYRGAVAVARWRAEGSGAVDSGVGPTVRVTSNRIEPGPSLELPFDYPLPAYPWTYAGELLTISWRLEVTLDAALLGDQTAGEAFVLAPAAGDGPRTGPATAKRGLPEQPGP